MFSGDPLSHSASAGSIATPRPSVAELAAGFVLLSIGRLLGVAVPTARRRRRRRPVRRAARPAATSEDLDRWSNEGGALAKLAA